MVWGRARFAVDAADDDGDGKLSMNEFFQFSLGAASKEFGSRALELEFEKYDTKQSGVLEQREFTKLAVEMGFGTVSSDIFRALDADQSGGVTYGACRLWVGLSFPDVRLVTWTALVWTAPAVIGWCF